MKSKDDIAGSRAGDSWFSDEQLTQVEPSELHDELHSPVPTRMHSSGEYMPHPQTHEQRQVEDRIKGLAENASNRMGMSRRRFLATSGGMAACFLAMNETYGPFFDVEAAELEPGGSGKRGPPSDLFVLDDQLHTMRGNLAPELLPLLYGNRAICQGPTTPGFKSNPFAKPGQVNELGEAWTPWNPKLVGLPVEPEMYQVTQFIKDVFLDSQVTVGVLSNAPGILLAALGGAPPPRPKNISESAKAMVLTPEQTVRVRDFVNQTAQSQRCLAHGILYPGVGNLDYVRYQAEELRPDSWKGYTAERIYSAKVDKDPESLLMEWRLDDEAVAYPTFKLISEFQEKYRRDRPGFGTICIHKGPSTSSKALPQFGHPADVPKAAKDWPNLNFVIYHSCIGNLFWPHNALQEVRAGQMREGVPNIRYTTEFAQTTASLKNVYAEIGTTFASAVVTFPTVCAHILGQLLKYKGADNVVFGSDYPWAGAPQWQIEALWRFQIPEELQKKYGYPALTETMRRKIFGLNSARIYGLKAANPQLSAQGLYKPVPADFASRIDQKMKKIMEYPGYSSDKIAEMRRTYQSMGVLPDHTRHGWVRRG